MDNRSARENLRRFRESRRLSQDAFADEIGISRISYGRLETGKTKLFSCHLLRIASAFGTSVEEILLGFKPVPETQVLNSEAERENIREQREYYENLLEAEREKSAGLESIVRGLQKEVETLRMKLDKKE